MKRTIYILILIISSLGINAQTLTLDSCLKIAHRHAIAAHDAEIDVQIAQEQKRQAFTKYFPQVQAMAVGFYNLNPMIDLGIDDISNKSTRDVVNMLYYNYGAALGFDRSVTYFQHGTVASLVATQPVFMGGRIYNGNQLAEVGVEAAKIQKNISNIQLDNDVEQAFWLVFSLEQKQQVVIQAAVLMEQLSADVKNAVDAGLAINNDKIKIQIEQNEIESKRVSLENGIRLAKWALCQTIGIEPSDSFNIDVPRQMMISMPSYINEEEAALVRPEYNLLELNLYAEKLKKRMAIGEALPSLVVGAGYSYNNLFQKNANNGSIFFTAVVPLTAWWETSHKIKQHNLQITKAENMRRDYFEKMELELRQAWNEVEQAARQLPIRQQTVQNAKENLRINQLNYNAGLITLSEYLQAQTLYTQALEQESEARTNLLFKISNYKRLINH